MNRKQAKRWVAIFMAAFCMGLLGAICATVYVDPFFHYHAPRSEAYYYRISNERSQNDGITRHFDYTGIITGTSVTQNFKASQAERLFGGTFIKIPYAGATYREINEGIIRALERNPSIHMVIRGLDLEYILAPKDYMRSDMGERPEYLYDENWINDVSYLLNRDVLFSWTCRMLIEKRNKSFRPGVTSFDDYSSWTRPSTWYGASEVCPEGLEQLTPGTAVHLSEEEEERVLASVHQNMTDTADQYPNVSFVYFIPPNSMVWWYRKVEEGSVYSILEAERIMMEEILKHPNIKLFSWNDRLDLSGNLDNYADTVHYGEWVNDLILESIRAGEGIVSKENYNDLLSRELHGYLNFDYQAMLKQ